jgi:hypothetical protein
MHVLHYLSDPECLQKSDDSLLAEYRLLCSGMLYRQLAEGPYDWAKSEVSRILLDKPLLLFVASRPYEEYPLELVLHVKVALATDSAYNFSRSYHPDEEVAKDLAALLTLLCRRLITVAGKASERHFTTIYRHPLFDDAAMPTPLANTLRKVYWPQHPYSFLTGWETQEVLDYNPSLKPVDAKEYTRLLLGLPRLPHAQSIVASTRLYALALELIHERPDISYQFLISSVERLADAAFGSFQPPAAEQVQHQRGVYELALNLGLQDESATDLALAACKPLYWATRKFKKFLLENVSESVWKDPDDLFPKLSDMFLPDRANFEKILATIYDARSKATHLGHPFPATASHAGGPSIPAEFMSSFHRSHAEGSLMFPPVAWFERVVHSAISNFWLHSNADAQQAPQVNESPSPDP